MVNFRRLCPYLYLSCALLTLCLAGISVKGIMDGKCLVINGLGIAIQLTLCGGAVWRLYRPPWVSGSYSFPTLAVAYVMIGVLTGYGACMLLSNRCPVCDMRAMKAVEQARARGQEGLVLEAQDAEPWKGGSW